MTSIVKQKRARVEGKSTLPACQNTCSTRALSQLPSILLLALENG